MQDDLCSNLILEASENIRPIYNWNLSNNTLSKTFRNQISYPITITDYAGNKSEILIDVKKASNINLLYTTYDSYSRFSNSSNGNIAGNNTISANVSNKTESLFIALESTSIDLNLQTKAYVHTYWPEGSKAHCGYTENYYYSGANPENNTWQNISTDNLLWHINKIHSQIGGTGMNKKGASCISPKLPIPEDISVQNLYGISSIAFKISNSHEYSVVYQTYINGLGWQKTCSNGEEAVYDYTKPFSAIRINIIPTVDKDLLINYWNKNM